MSRSFSPTSNMDYGSSGMTSRNLNAYMLSHSTLGSWVQFYHKPYQCDWAEATQKAIERKRKEEGKDFSMTSDKILTNIIKSGKKKREEKK